LSEETAAFNQEFAAIFQTLNLRNAVRLIVTLIAEEEESMSFGRMKKY